MAQVWVKSLSEVVASARGRKEIVGARYNKPTRVHSRQYSSSMHVSDGYVKQIAG